MAKVKTQCDNCKKAPLRKAEAYYPKYSGGIKSRYNVLCPKCWNLWIDNKLPEKVEVIA